MKIAAALLAIALNFVWPNMSLAFASRMAVSKSLKGALPNLYSASLIPIQIGDDDTVSEGTDSMTLQQVAINECNGKDVSLAFVVRRPG